MQKKLDHYNLALIGKHISKSGSPALYKKLLGQRVSSYTLLDYKSSSLIPKASELLATYDGISVTAPYKHEIFKQCDELSKIASKCKAVNCISRSESGKILGTLTDYDAAKELLQSSLFPLKSLPVTILGDGAMGRMISVLLKELNIISTVGSRRLGWGEVFTIPSFYINTCLKEAEFPAVVPAGSFVWDFNYNYQSAFQEREGVRYEDGSSLLRKQALYALKFWNISNY